jgi:hypothetical protein
MTRKKTTIILEGNEKQVESAIHELSKLKSEANRQPELTASMQTESLSENGNYDTAFQSAAGHD